MLYLRLLTICYDLNIIKRSIFFPRAIKFQRTWKLKSHYGIFMIRKKSNINVYVKRPKIKVMNFMAMIIMITWKWRLETRRRFPTWCFGWSTRTHQYWRSGSTRVIYSPVSTAYRTHELKYPKVYLSLKTFKSLIEHSWFFLLLYNFLSVQQWPVILGTPHITLR